MIKTQSKKDCPHFSAGMACYVDPVTQEIYFLVIEYQEAGRSDKAFKFPGGKCAPQSEVANETSHQTLSREWQKEVGTEVLGAIDFKHIPKSPTHSQYFYVISYQSLKGKIRKAEMTDEEVGRRPEILGPPTWISSEELLNGPRRIFMSHAEPLKWAVDIVRECLKGPNAKRFYATPERLKTFV